MEINIVSRQTLKGRLNLKIPLHCYFSCSTWISIDYKINKNRLQWIIHSIIVIEEIDFFNYQLFMESKLNQKDQSDSIIKKYLIQHLLRMRERERERERA